MSTFVNGYPKRDYRITFAQPDHVAEISNMDLISRQAAIDAVAKAVTEGYGVDCGVIHSDVIYEVLQGLPPVNPDIDRFSHGREEKR